MAPSPLNVTRRNLMLNKSVILLSALVAFAAHATASAALCVFASSLAKTAIAAPVKDLGPTPSTITDKVLRTIPRSLNWSCSAQGSGEYACTDPLTGKSYMCTNADSSGARVCEVGDDIIPGSTV
jgi:hypothetical protein